MSLWQKIIKSQEEKRQKEKARCRIYFSRQRTTFRVLAHSQVQLEPATTTNENKTVVTEIKIPKRRHHRNDQKVGNESGDESCEEEFDYSELSSAGEIGSAISDFRDAIESYYSGDYKGAAYRSIKATACLAGYEEISDFLSYIDDGSDLVAMYNNEEYLNIMSKVIKLIPPTGEPEIDISVSILKAIEWHHIGHAMDAWSEGEYRLFAEEIADALLPKSMENLVHGAKPTTAAPVMIGVTAGYYGFKGKFGYGMRSNFLLGSFFTTLTIRLTRIYRRNSRRPVLKHLFTSFDEHLILT